MMESLVSPARHVVIDGERYAINTDFRVWAEIESIMLCESGDDFVRLGKIFALAYPHLPHNPVLALKCIMNFYGGSEDAEGSETQSTARLPLYCVKQDFAYIYAAFLSEFGIDLCRDTLHWWRFRALIGAIGENTMFSKIVSYRASEPAQIKDKELRRHYEKMKKRFALRLRQSDEESAARFAECIEGLF